MINTIESATGAPLDEKKVIKSDDSAKEDPYAAMSPKDKISAQTMAETMNVLKVLQVSTQQGGTRPASYLTTSRILHLHG